MIGIGAEPRIAKTTVDPEFGVVGLLVEEFVVRGITMQNWRRHAIDEVRSSGESIAPVGFGH